MRVLALLEVAPLPLAFTAATVKMSEWPEVNPVMVAVVPEMATVASASWETTTWYPVIAEDPSLSGVDQVRVTDEVEVTVAVRSSGADATVVATSDSDADQAPAPSALRAAIRK
jgi:hypothetical protein